jgi:uncharacterized protein (TIGR03437 family)
MRRLAAIVLLMGWPAGAYYHFVRYNTSAPPFQPIPDRFDLAALPGKAVPYLITTNGPLTLAPGDSETSVLSQIQAAAAVWSSVPTSELRLVFAGMRDDGIVPNTPYIQIEFTDELPPGVIAQGGPISRLDPAGEPGAVFTPIARSLLRLPKDLSSRPSWSERFFLTVVHEFGHTIGLQHSWTSGVMSTEITRATTKARPLAQDDVAGISLLYPTPEFRKTTGSITGRVTLNGQGVALASVVAIVSGRTAVSALTAPDGSFRIDGLLPGYYFLYVHPLPPAIAGEPQPVNLELPETPTGRVRPGPVFQSVFYPGAPLPSSTVAVEAGKTVEGIEFRVTPIARVNLHSVQTYSFFNRIAIKPATLQIASDWRSVVFTGYGASSLSPGLSVSILNAPESIAAGSLRDYSPGYLQADVKLTPFSSDGPRHLVFQLNGETYVLPSGLVITRKKPPSITGVTPRPDGWLLLEGSNLDAQTAVWVDGVAAKTRLEDGKLYVLPPPAPAGHQGALVALNPDGQSSLYFHGNSPPLFSYADTESPAIEVPSVRIPAGAEMALELRASKTNLRLWTPWLGTGTSDVGVRGLWVTGESSAIAWLVASPTAAASVNTWSAGVGLAPIRLTQTLTVGAADGTPFVRMSRLADQYIHPGGLAVLPVTNIPLGLNVGSVKVQIGRTQATVLQVGEGTITVRVPTELAPGTHMVELTLAGTKALPAAIEVRPVPPLILGAFRADGSAPITAEAPARAGDVVLLAVARLGEAAEIPASEVAVSTGQVRHEVRAVRPNPAQPGTHLLEIRLAAAEPADGSIPLVVSRNGAYNVEPFLLPYVP